MLKYLKSIWINSSFVTYYRSLSQTFNNLIFKQKLSALKLVLTLIAPWFCEKLLDWNVWLWIPQIVLPRSRFRSSFYILCIKHKNCFGVKYWEKFPSIIIISFCGLKIIRCMIRQWRFCVCSLCKIESFLKCFFIVNLIFKSFYFLV